MELGAYLRFIRLGPTLKYTAFATGLIMGAGDVASQLCVERRPLQKYEYKRTLRFAFLGSFFVGPG